MNDHLRYEDYQRLLASLCWRSKRAGSALDIEDMMQEVAITFVRAREKFDPARGVAFSTYLWRAAQNDLGRLAQDARLHTTHTVSIDGAADSDTALHDILCDLDQEAVEDRLQRRERAAQNVAALSDDARLIVRLLERPPPALLREVDRARAFSCICRKRGYASPVVKLGVTFIGQSLGFDDMRARRVARELRRVAER